MQRLFLQKVLDKVGNIEVSARQAADAMLGNESFHPTILHIRSFGMYTASTGKSI